jgi:hypothetical protein
MPVVGLALALVFMAVGSVTRHDVLLWNADELSQEFGLPPPFESLTDADTVIDTTFTGIVRKGEKLQFTYDRSKPKGRRLCPT